MSCKLNHKEALLNSREFLIEQQAIDKLSTILNLQKFEEVNSTLSNDAFNAYGVEGNLWSEKSGRAVPNKSVLKSIDDKRKELGIYDSKDSVEMGLPTATLEAQEDPLESVEDFVEEVDYTNQDFIEDRNSIKLQNQLLSDELNLESFDEMFPDMDYLSGAEKLILIKAIEDGKFSISCTI